MNPTQSTTVGYTDVAVTRLGFGTAPLGNMYRDIPEDDARATVRHAYESGIRLFDTAPLYGKGLAEERLGHALHSYPRDSYTISTKIGRVLNADRSDFKYDYSRDGVMRSLEGSLKRLQTDRVDVVLVHDPDADNVDHEQDALNEAFPTLIDLREQGVIGAVGSGMNQWQMLQRFAEGADVNCFLLAGRYTLLEQSSLDFLEMCRQRNIGIFLGGVYNSGILAKGPGDEAKYNYQNAPSQILEKARRIREICHNHDVALNVGALHFAGGHRAVTSLVIGAETAEEVTNNIESMQANVPAALWTDLRDAGLIDADAPLPSA